MKVSAIRLVNFRNHSVFEVEDIASQLIVISGANGTGKTSVLEAVSAFNPGRGIRSELPAAAVKGGGDSWFVSLKLAGGEGGKVASQLDMSWDNRRRQVVLNQAKRVVLSDVLGMMPTLWLHPGSDRLPDAPPASRLKFIDRLASVFDKGHLTRLASLERRRGERRQVLASVKPDALWLDTLEHSIAQDAVAVAAARIYLLRQLEELKHPELAQGVSKGSAQGLAKGTAKGVARGQNRGQHKPSSKQKDKAESSQPAKGWGLPPLRLTGTAEGLVMAHPALRAEGEFAKILAESRGGSSPFYGGLEFAPYSATTVGGAGSGAGSGAKGYVGSTGENKLLTLSLIFTAALLIQKRLGILPILLLDELPAHLDKPNRTRVMAFLRQLKAQAWITTTEPSGFVKGKCRHIKLG